MSPPKDPESCSVFDLYKLFATQAQQDELAAKYRSGGMGYGEAKKALYEAAMDHFGEAFGFVTRTRARVYPVRFLVERPAFASRMRKPLRTARHGECWPRARRRRRADGGSARDSAAAAIA